MGNYWDKSKLTDEQWLFLMADEMEYHLRQPEFRVYSDKAGRKMIQKAVMITNKYASLRQIDPDMVYEKARRELNPLHKRIYLLYLEQMYYAPRQGNQG